MVSAFEDWQKLKRVGVTGRAWGIQEGNGGKRQCCGGNGRCRALLKGNFQGKARRFPPMYPSPEGKREGSGGFRNQESGGGFGPWVSGQRSKGRPRPRPGSGAPSPGTWESRLEETESCTASPRWGADDLASGAQQLGIGAPSSGHTRESDPLLSALAQPLPLAACTKPASTSPLRRKHVVEPGPATRIRIGLGIAIFRG